MRLPPLLELRDEAAYRKYFSENYIDGPKILTFDGIWVKFFPSDFDHAFFESISRSARDKSLFSILRAQRMNWISSVLNNGAAELYRYIENGKLRRIALDPDEFYLVVIGFPKESSEYAYFVTAYVADSEATLNNVRANSKW